MMKCPFCGVEMKYHIAKTELDGEREASIVINYVEVFTCATHGSFQRDQWHREIMIYPKEEA